MKLQLSSDVFKDLSLPADTADKWFKYRVNKAVRGNESHLPAGRRTVRSGGRGWTGLWSTRLRPPSPSRPERRRRGSPSRASPGSRRSAGLPSSGSGSCGAPGPGCGRRLPPPATRSGVVTVKPARVPAGGEWIRTRRTYIDDRVAEVPLLSEEDVGRPGNEAAHRHVWQQVMLLQRHVGQTQVTLTDRTEIQTQHLQNF